MVALVGDEIEVPTLTGTEKVNVTPGTSSGDTLPLAGKGMPVRNRPGEFGDLVLRFTVDSPPPKDGADVHETITISLQEAFTGLTRKIGAAEVEIPAGITDGDTLPLPGAGEPGEFGGKNGDLIVTVRFKKPAPIKGANIYRSITIEWAEAQGGLTRSLRVDGRSVSVQFQQAQKMVTKSE